MTGSSTRGHQGGLVTQGPKDMTSLPGQVSLEITHVDAEVFTLTRIKEFLVLRIQKHVIIKDSNFSIKPRFKIFAFDDNDAGLEAVAGHGTFLFARHRDTRRVPLQL